MLFRRRKRGLWILHLRPCIFVLIVVFQPALCSLHLWPSVVASEDHQRFLEAVEFARAADALGGHLRALAENRLLTQLLRILRLPRLRPRTRLAFAVRRSPDFADYDDAPFLHYTNHSAPAGVQAADPKPSVGLHSRSALISSFCLAFASDV